MCCAGRSLRNAAVADPLTAVARMIKPLPGHERKRVGRGHLQITRSPLPHSGGWPAAGNARSVLLRRSPWSNFPW